MQKYKWVLVFVFLLPIILKAQNDTSGVNKSRLRSVVYAEVGLYGVSMTGLYSLWYKDYPSSGFHFFNDNDEWKGMDKIGHCKTSYTVGEVGYYLLRWAHVPKKKAIWYGGTLGLAFLTTVEFFDGISDGWGFSPGDMVANVTGSALFITQQMAWEDQHIRIKFSYHESPYAISRPNVLGSTLAERFLKDYNAQTYWLSFNLYSFMPQATLFPKWLNIAVGYGANGMFTGVKGMETQLNPPLPSVDRYAQLYIAPDIDLSRIRIKNKYLKYALTALSIIKFPFPALEINTMRKGVKFYPIY